MASSPLSGIVWDSPAQTPSTRKVDFSQIRKEMEIAEEEQPIHHFWCSMEGKTTFEGQGTLFTNFFCFRSKSQARLVTVGTDRPKKLAKI